jgi:lipoprotein-anchoring transpeptidase ErfK/SrfK
VGFWSDGNNVIGFHGTPEEALIGQAVSHGCVRMRNADVAEFFDRVQVGTPVVVEP